MRAERPGIFCNSGPHAIALRLKISKNAASIAITITTCDKPTTAVEAGAIPPQKRPPVAVQHRLDDQNPATTGSGNVAATAEISPQTKAAFLAALENCKTVALELKQDSTSRAQGKGGFNVPSLFGLSLGAPYLHHGQASTLDELFTDPKWLAHAQAGNANFLVGDQAATQRADLINFLLSIDLDTPPFTVPAGANTCP